MTAFTAQVSSLAHIGGAICALCIGALVIFTKKGTTAHRWLGATYAALLVLLDVAALTIHEEATFGPFHILALLSLATIAAGASMIRLTQRRSQGIAVHAYLMLWSYAGLVAAGIGQLSVQMRAGPPTSVVIVATLVCAGLIIHLRTPATLRRLLG